MRLPVIAIFTVVAFSAVLALSSIPSQAQPPGGMPQGGGMERRGDGPPRGGNMAGAPVDSFAADRDSLVKLTMERIAGREKAPAESVFKNIQVMKGRTAEQLVRGMNGMGRSLGVGCIHCHVENHWADEDKPTKEVARNMLRLTTVLNDSLIPQYKWPHDDKPRVGCFTCHHGQAKPGGMGRGPGGPGGRPGGPGGPGGPNGQGGDRR